MKMTFTGSSARSLEMRVVIVVVEKREVSGWPSLISLIRSHSHTKQPNELSVRLVCAHSGWNMVEERSPSFVCACAAQWVTPPPFRAIANSISGTGQRRTFYSLKLLALLNWPDTIGNTKGLVQVKKCAIQLHYYVCLLILKCGFLILPVPFDAFILLIIVPTLPTIVAKINTPTRKLQIWNRYSISRSGCYKWLSLSLCY